jgi:hypothetical protein
MRWLPHYLDAFNAADNGNTARDAEHRAMYAREDALPLPDEPERTGWLASILGRGSAGEPTRPTQSAAGIRMRRGNEKVAGSE